MKKHHFSSIGVIYSIVAFMTFSLCAPTCIIYLWPFLILKSVIAASNSFSKIRDSLLYVKMQNLRIMRVNFYKI